MIDWSVEKIPEPGREELFGLTADFGGVSLYSSGTEEGWDLTGINPVIVIGENYCRRGKETFPHNDPLAELDRVAEEIGSLPDEVGLIGHISYDFKDRFEEKGLYKPRRQGIFEDFRFALFEYYYLACPGKEGGRVYRLSFPFPYETVNPVGRTGRPLRTGNSRITGTDKNRQDFSRAVDSTIGHIRAGDIYQANITRRIGGETGEDPVSLALSLAASNRISYGVFASIPGGHVISTSPELFFRTEGGRLLSSPIKGTLPRLPGDQRDREQRETLLGSEKNLAELAMIVDLLRNDMSLVCEPGTVEVAPFPKIMTLENVHHLYADILGRLKEGSTAGNVLSALFPGGSITGCPKIRACQIIDELEGSPRGLYTGSFGFINGRGRSVFNILIRTLFLHGNQFFYNVGGGITLLSDGDEEFEETEHKGANIRKALEPGGAS